MSIIKNRIYRARLMLKNKLASEGKEGIIWWIAANHLTI
jgi:hypothetical protein